MNKLRFSKADRLTAFIAMLVSFAIYAWTAASNVTLLDSGEFLVAAQHFGVPHPTGYPLWTILSWLFLLLPLGNPAWEIAIFSGLCGAFAVALCALISSHAIRWLFPSLKTSSGSVISLTCSLLAAFSVSMWSQATISEVYALHALLIGLFFLALYRFIHAPESDWNIIWCFFFLALAFSNHHLTLVMIPVLYLAVLLLRREIMFDLLVFSVLTAALFLMGYGSLSEDLALLKTSIRFTWCALAGLGILVWVKRGHVEWKLLTFLPIVIAAGLLPYLYMPLASSTNPPMNWGYAREKAGFYYSVNRTQYSGPLSSQIQKTLGRLMGSKEETNQASVKEPNPFDASTFPLHVRARQWVGYFWLQLAGNFTPLCVIAFFAAFLSILRLDLPHRCWIYVLNVAFVLAAFLQPLMDGAEISNDGWWLQMPYHTYTNWIFAALSAIGLAFIWVKISGRFPKWNFAVWILLLLPLWLVNKNYVTNSQRDHWFGWMYGHDMLKELPKGSVVFGGTDPGRFVPTYMIFGESALPAKWKRDPDFDRRDLYIITQNALGDAFYTKYIADHYGEKRPAVKNAFERWLGRENQYPEKPLKLPTVEEIGLEAKKMMLEGGKNDPGQPMDANAIFHSAGAKLIFEWNKKDHEFFVEESFPMEWTYPYAVPEGLVYRINPEPLKSLPQEVVDEDFKFWDKYIRDLISHPQYWNDYDAKRSFSKLRVAMAHIYRFRKMEKETERALRQALLLWPENPEVLVLLSTLLWERDEYDESVQLFEKAAMKDLNNLALLQLYDTAVQRKKLQGEIQNAEAVLTKNPKDRESFNLLVDNLIRISDTNRLTKLLQDGRKNFAQDDETLKRIAQYYVRETNYVAARQTVEQLTKLAPGDPQHWYELSRLSIQNRDTNASISAAERAIREGGFRYHEMISKDPLYQSLRTNAQFQRLLLSPMGIVPQKQYTNTYFGKPSTGTQAQKIFRSP